MAPYDNPVILYIGSPYYHYNREVFAHKITTILSEICRSVHVIGANKPAERENIHWTKLRIRHDISSIYRYLEFFRKQFDSIMIPYKQDIHYDGIVLRSATYSLPILFSRLYSIPEATIVTQKTRNPLQNKLSKINFHLSQCLIVEAENVGTEWGSAQHEDKIVQGPTYVDEDSYNYIVPFNSRDNIIGYVGLLDYRKGIDKLLTAIQKASDRRRRYKFKIGGKGPLRKETERIESKEDQFNYLGFIPEEDMLDFYNGLRLFVLPTESEGLPNVALEAMACGTPVLTTPVGGLPDIIQDGETGFLMTDNNPSTILENITRALNHENLGEISENARELIERKYRLESAVKRYEQIIYKDLALD